MEASALALVADHRWMVRFVAAKAGELRPEADADALAAAGDVALLDAALWFVPSRGPSFPRYAWQSIERAVRDMLALRPLVARVRSRAVEAFIETIRGDEDVTAAQRPHRFGVARAGCCRHGTTAIERRVAT